MSPPGFGLLWSWLSRGMSRTIPELRPPGKRWLVAGLGNYRLQGTRHSVGMAVLNQLAQHLNVADQWKKQHQCHADVAVACLGEAELVLLKPRRFMNVNGLSVAQAAKMYQLAAEDIYLVHDELDKPLGKLAMKLGGSASGHNGVRSCISCLNSNALADLPTQGLWNDTCWTDSQQPSKSNCPSCWSRPQNCYSATFSNGAWQEQRVQVTPPDMTGIGLPPWARA
ncbi:probable peptidyl-tRNA hydrolase isoform X1 [Monodelphis domestica]|uniref:probable peptidyl-tRNA hydrolase isoform X1 n=1 Tax=Monodelphis domestica TaxID=13616 RepID=UPI0024E1E736|nr:probable peptidyl-tRNA hydrolase isoform X1 [Monodelphis domestica]